ncbi:hypothetical protein [Lactiplantibacillus plajomi]|uniref:Uncharacterized protein n=1 Tax=Lactiplantibacillus plajomi TaxID=1457217 RepID=A0ABV6JZL8_9LACO|nr:hypothetical protein [Lactiplantibacillus plajomi]
MPESWYKKMRERRYSYTCVYCGLIFTDESNSTKYCADCRRIVGFHKRGTDVKMIAGCKTRVYHNRCQRCHRIFEARSNRTKYCDECKALNAEEKRQQRIFDLKVADMRSAQYVLEREPTYQNMCARCGQQFASLRTRKAYCDHCYPIAMAKKRQDRVDFLTKKTS